MNSVRQDLRKLVKAVALIAVAALAGGQLGCAPGFYYGCTWGSRTPEVRSFYGAPRDVSGKADHADMKLRHRNAFMYIVEGPAEADLAFYRRSPASNQWTVWRWSGTPEAAKEIAQKESTNILSKQGAVCLGDETQKLVEAEKDVRKEVPKEVSKEVPEDETTKPPSNAEDFNRILAKYARSYVSFSFFLLC
jgi:hypothetical protein